MRASALAVGDGALGFWKALRDLFADTKEQRCWWHKIGNVLAALPKSAHKDAKAALAEIYNAEDRDHAEQAARAAKAFAAAYGANPVLTGEDVEVAQSGREDHPPAHHQPDRVDLRNRPATAAGHQGTRLAGRRDRDGVQNSSSRHSTAGVPSIPPTSSRWSEPARSSRTASSSNDPTNQQAVTLTPHDTLIHRP